MRAWCFSQTALPWFAFGCCLIACPDSPAAAPAADQAPSPSAASETPGREPIHLRRLAKDDEVWVDMQHKVVVLGGQVCLRKGPLEMFACPKGTKDYESIVSVNTKAKFVHAALLAVGARAGRPVQYYPKYAPASGTTVDITVEWTDSEGKRRRTRAQNWIHNVRTGQPMKYAWVFAGSGFWNDEETGQRHYLAEAGDLICVSNFPSATLDLPVHSSQQNSELLYEAFTQRIPPVGTKLRLLLQPQRKPSGEQPPHDDQKPPPKPGGAKSSGPP